MKKWLNSPDLGLLIFRVMVGLAMAFGHGMGKMPPSEKFIEGVGALGFPLPILFAWSAGLSEFLGGLLIASGLFTRPAAGFLAFTMAVAAFGRHAADPFNVKEMAYLYLASSLALVFLGAGKFSLDRIIRKK